MGGECDMHVFLGSVDGQKVVLFSLDSREKWLAGML